MISTWRSLSDKAFKSTTQVFRFCSNLQCWVRLFLEQPILCSFFLFGISVYHHHKTTNFKQKNYLMSAMIINCWVCSYRDLFSLRRVNSICGNHCHLNINTKTWNLIYYYLTTELFSSLLHNYFWYSIFFFLCKCICSFKFCINLYSRFAKCF